MGAGKGWSTHENLLACKDFVSASQNSLKGNGQKTEKFEKHIEGEFNTLTENLKNEVNDFKESCKRSGSSISQRFKTIRKACLTFHCIVEQIKNSKPTGCPSDPEIRTAATAIYNGLGTVNNVYHYISSEDAKVGKPFLYMNCYLWLIETYLWKMIIHSTTKATKTDRDQEKSEKEEKDESKKSSQDDNSSTKNTSATEWRTIGSKRAAANK